MIEEPHDWKCKGRSSMQKPDWCANEEIRNAVSIDGEQTVLTLQSLTQAPTFRIKHKFIPGSEYQDFRYAKFRITTSAILHWC